MSTGIYKIENLINGKIYIGQSIHIERRWQEHCQKSSTSLISQAIQKYGKENFSFQILQEVTDVNTLNQLESNYIQYFNSLVPNGYNIVLIDDNQHHQFNKYSQDILFAIINDIKNSELSFQKIANKYDLDISMIYYLNRGNYHNIPTETYPLRSVKNISKQIHYCIDCGCEISKNAIRCNKCNHLLQYKTQHPNREQLKFLIRQKSFVDIAKDFKVSDNTIRKWCKKENLPYKSSEIKKYTDEQWEKI